MNKIGVIGTGIWGTGLSITAARAGNEVLCWARAAMWTLSKTGRKK